MPDRIQKITTCLGFDDCAEEAVKFYVSIFPGARITGITRCGEGERGGPKGRARTVMFTLLGQPFLALNAGTDFKFTDGISLMVSCATQKEIDSYWRRLSEGGEEVMCGWLRDRFGVSWQVVPAVLQDLISDRDPDKSAKVMSALMKMRKLDIAALREAHGDIPKSRRRKPA